MRFGFLLILLFYIARPTSQNVIGEAVDVLHLIKEVTKTILKTWNLVEPIPRGKEIELPFLEDKQHKIMQSIEAVNQRIRQSEQMQSLLTTLTIETLSEEFHAQSLILHKMNTVKDLTKMIIMRYAQLGDYEKHKDTLEPITMQKFAEWNVDPGSNSLSSLLDLLHAGLFGEEEDLMNETSNAENSLLNQLTQSYASVPDQMCVARQSPQQFAHEVFSKAAMTELKAYSMMEFSWMILRSFGRGNFSQEISLMRQNHQRRLDTSKLVLKKVMQRSDRVFWRCDPDGKKDKYALGVNYDEVTRLLQGYLENEINLNANQHCWGTCDDHHNTRAEGCYQPEVEYCGMQAKCNGKLYNCQYTDSEMSLCPSEANTTRRYEFIELEDGTMLGGGTCPRNRDKLESWWYYLFWRCSYCFCLCDEQGPLSDRYFSLRDTVTDFKLNKVATGVRFVKHQRVFQLQLQQGQLLPRAAINHSTLEWLPLEEIDLNDVDVRNGFDYHTLSFDSRTLDLDEITSNSSNHLVTGVRFRVLGKHLNLEVRLSEFNFTSGLLLDPQTHSFWLSNDNTDVFGANPRQKLILKNPHVPIRTQLKSLPLSTNNQFMDFVSSSADNDAGQSTVPFIDIQEVVPQPVIPLAGLGLYHKGREGFGGFFAPKVITYDMSTNFLQPH